MENVMSNLWVIIPTILIIGLIVVLLIIYFIIKAQNKNLSDLDLIILSNTINNFKLLLLILPEQSTVDSELEKVRSVEKLLGIDPYDFTIELNAYHKLKKEIDERGYI